MMSARLAKHKTGYNSEWEAEHTWVFYVVGEGMYCTLCYKFNTRNHQNQSKVWNAEACTTLRKDVLASHKASNRHKEAVEPEHACQVVKAQGGIREAFQGQVHQIEQILTQCVVTISSFVTESSQ